MQMHGHPPLCYWLACILARDWYFGSCALVHMLAINHRADQVGAGIRAAAAQKAWEPVARTGSFEANFPSLYSIEHGLQLGDNNRRTVLRLDPCTEYADLFPHVRSGDEFIDQQ